MRRSNRSVLGVAVVLAVLIASVGYPVPVAQGESSAAPTHIDTCTTITEPGRYVLTADIENSTNDTCIRIRSSDVVLDGAGHAISGVQNESSIAAATTETIPPLEKIGVAVNASTPLSNVTVQRLAVSGWFFGIYYDDVSTVTVRDVTVSNNGVGVYVRNSRDVAVTNVTPTNNTISGILVESTRRTVTTTSSANRSVSVSIGNVTVSTNGSVDDSVNEAAVSDGRGRFPIRTQKIGAGISGVACDPA